MQNSENSTNLINKIAHLYGQEMIFNRSNSVEGLVVHLNEIIAKIMHINKNIIMIARQWHKIIERAAISNRIDKVKQILNQEEILTTIQLALVIEETEEIEIITETKILNKPTETHSKKAVEIEIEIKKEKSSQIAFSNSETKLQDIDKSEDLLEIKPEG